MAPHPAVGRRFRVIKGETGWQLAPTGGDHEMATVVRVSQVADQLLAYAVVTTSTGRVIDRPAFRVTDVLLQEDG